MILAGDIGATNSRLGIFDLQDGQLVPVLQKRFQNQQFEDLDKLLDAFPADLADITCVCLGVAGAVLNGQSSITNLSWKLDIATIRNRYRNATVALINDVEAAGYGVGLVRPEEMLVLNQGVPVPRATAALIAAGTGLGESILYYDGKSIVPLPAEAGHTDFAPNNEMESDFLGHLRASYGHVSFDRVLSGPGLFLMYQFLTSTGRARESAEIAVRFRNGDPNAVIAEAALQHECDACVRALDMFVDIYGAESGNLALRALARGGVYLAGGIAPKIKGKLADGSFMRAFCAKGRMAEFLATIPVHVILNENTALLGAAHYGSRLIA